MGPDRRPPDHGRGANDGRIGGRRSTRTRRSTSRWSRSRDRARGRRDRGRPTRSARPASRAREAGELSEAQLEALLFVAEKPLSRREIALLAGVDRATVDALLGDLEVSLAGRGIRLILSGDHVELTTAPEAGALIARYVGADAVRLSPAALETLAIVAYRQPVTRAAIERIRGVDSDYTVRALLHRRLIVELGRSDAPGRPYRLRHRLRVPRAVRADVARGAARRSISTSRRGWHDEAAEAAEGAERRRARDRPRRRRHLTR